MPKKIHIAIGGGSCTGKSTLAAKLFAQLKISGYDFDLVMEASRKIKKEFHTCRSPFDRFFLWHIQQCEEKNSTARNGFITDAPLFQYYAHALQWSRTRRDALAVQELFKMSLDANRTYGLVVLNKKACEIAYKKDGSRTGSKKHAHTRHALVRSYIETYFPPDHIVYIDGTLEKRVKQILKKLHEIGFGKIPKKLRTI